MRPRRQVPSSSTRDILRLIEGRESINFSAGLPALELIPVDALRAAVERVLAGDACGALSYGTTEGYAPLRAFIAEQLLRPRGLPAEADQILITSGAQQGLDLVAKVFVDQTTELLVERPTYLAAIQAFSVFGPSFSDVPLGPSGLEPEALEQALERRRPAFLYSIPSFHNPAGTCVPTAQHVTLAESLLRHEVPLVEDTPYLELSYETEVPDCLARYMGEQAIVLGSASKLVSPGLRLGWLWTKAPVMRDLVAAKQAADLCGSAFTQRVLFEVLSAMDVEAHMRRLRHEYRLRRDVMVQAVQAQFPAGTTFTVPSGGMFLWVSLPGTISTRALLKRVLARGVVFTPGLSFFACEPRPDNFLRLNFTGNAPERIVKGVAVIGEEIRELGAAAMGGQRVAA